MASKKFYFIKLNGKFAMKSATEKYKFKTEQSAVNTAIILYGRNADYEIVYEFETKKII